MIEKTLQDQMKLNNGVGIHCIGYGTFQTPVEETFQAVAKAIELGYRHIDTASYYQNEAGVGKAVRESGLPREEFFVTSKLWNSERGYEKTKAAFEKTMQELGLEYLDLYLIHWPANYLQFGAEAKKLNAETWRALEDLYFEGRIKAIGLSNFLPHHIENLMETAQVKPMVNQIELHPGWLQSGTIKYCQDQEILVEAWSPLGRKEVLENPVLEEIAQKYGKSTAQLCVRWVLQHGVLPLPKTVSAERMAANAAVFDFEISAEDMQTIDSLSNIGGQCARPDDVTF